MIPAISQPDPPRLWVPPEVAVIRSPKKIVLPPGSVHGLEPRPARRCYSRGMGVGFARGMRHPRATNLFVPKVPNLLLWFNYARKDSYTTGTGGISSVDSLAGSAHPLTCDQSVTTQRPDEGTINIKPAADFERDNADFLKSTSTFTHSIGTGTWYYASAINVESIPGLGNFWSMSNNQFIITTNNNGTDNILRFFDGTGSNFDSLPFSLSANIIIEMWRDSSNNLRARVNGTADTDSLTRTTDYGTGAVNLWMGVTDDTGSNAYDGLQGEVIFCNTDPGSVWRDRVFNYLNAEWRL